MAFPTSINDQITDAAKAGPVPDGASPGSIAELYTALAQSVDDLGRHATAAREHLHAIHAALTRAGVELHTAGMPLNADAPGAGHAPAEGSGATAPINDALDTAVNAQITDSAAPANAKEAGGSRIVITGNLYQATAQALANAAHNATAGEQQTALLAQASTVQGIITLLNADTAATGEGS